MDAPVAWIVYTKNTIISHQYCYIFFWKILESERKFNAMVESGYSGERAASGGKDNTGWLLTFSHLTSGGSDCTENNTDLYRIFTHRYLIELWTICVPGWWYTWWFYWIIIAYVEQFMLHIVLYKISENLYLNPV